MLIFRFLQIVSLAYLCSFFKMVSCQQRVASSSEGATARPHTLDRSYKLYNQCSGKHVQIVGKGVNARALDNSTSANMSFISVHTRHHHNAINIMGKNSSRYLCFNKSGKLVVKGLADLWDKSFLKPRNKKKLKKGQLPLNGRSSLCFFQEGLSPDHYTVFQSVYNPAWYLGFNGKGKPLKGKQHAKARLRRCFHFTKREGPKKYGLSNPTVKLQLKDLLRKLPR